MGKKPVIPLWEVNSNFDPLRAKQQRLTSDVFQTLVDQSTTYAGTWSKAEHVLSSLASFDLHSIPLRFLEQDSSLPMSQLGKIFYQG